MNSISGLGCNSWNSQTLNANTALNNKVAGKVDSSSASVALRMDALYTAATRLPGGGYMNASVYKSANFSSDNPVMLVKGTNVDGTPFEVEVNINDINPYLHSGGIPAIM